MKPSSRAPTTVVDDRERPHEMRSFARIAEVARDKHDHRTLVDAEHAPWADWRRAAGIGVSSVVCIAAALVVMRGGPYLYRREIFILPVVALVITLLVHLVYGRLLGGKRRSGQLVSFALLHGICPACGHSLEHLRAASDGCTVCPECSAAWRLSHPAVPKPPVGKGQQ